VVVRKLETRGLVERNPAADDARRAQLSLTAKARALLGRAPRAAQDRILHALAGMSESERRSLARLLGELAQRVSGGGDGELPAAMLFEDSDESKPSPRQQRRRKPEREPTPRSRKRLHR
jgi:hypothetical protein